MKYKITKENKPHLSTYGKYKAQAVHESTIESDQILREVAEHEGISEGAVLTAMMGLSHVIGQHLRRGDKVRLNRWGLMKLEIESEKVDSPDEFSAHKHIRGIRLHFIPESTGGSPDLYKDLHLEKVKQE